MAGWEPQTWPGPAASLMRASSVLRRTGPQASKVWGASERRPAPHPGLHSLPHSSAAASPALPATAGRMTEPAAGGTA